MSKNKWKHNGAHKNRKVDNLNKSDNTPHEPEAMTVDMSFPLGPGTMTVSGPIGLTQLEPDVLLAVFGNTAIHNQDRKSGFYPAFHDINILQASVYAQLLQWGSVGFDITGEQFAEILNIQQVLMSQIIDSAANLSEAIVDLTRGQAKLKDNAQILDFIKEIGETSIRHRREIVELYNKYGIERTMIDEIQTDAYNEFAKITPTVADYIQNEFIDKANDADSL